MDNVLAALPKRGAGVAERAKAIRHLSERRGQMRYGEYRSWGLPIGSRRVEAACKTVVGQRMKCTGMCWTVAGANPRALGALRPLERPVRRLPGAPVCRCCRRARVRRGSSAGRVATRCRRRR